MADKKVNIKITSESSEAEKAINNVTSKLNQLSKNKALTSMSKLGNAVTGVGVAFKGATSIISAVTNAIAGLSDAANVQASAEKQLEAAAANNPYLSEYNVAQLKNYASELQSISTVGDESLLPMMAQLAAAGRTQNEIQEIMAAALDMSASGAMSLETAVKQLNATYSGTKGRLSQLNSAIADMTTEQLKNGDAVKVMREQYKGIAQTVADTTGGWQQFKNTFGDFKEVIGSALNSLQNNAGKVLNNFFGAIIEKLQSAGKEADEFKKKLNIISTLEDSDASVEALNTVVNDLEKQVQRIQNIEAVAQGNSAKVKKNIQADAAATLQEIAKGRQEIYDKLADETAEYNKIQLELEANAAAYRNGELTKAEYEKNNELLKAEQVRIRSSNNLIEAELQAYDEANAEKIASSQAVIDQANVEIEKLKEAYGADYLNSYAAVVEEKKKLEAQLAAAIAKRDEAQQTANKNAEKTSSAEADKQALELITKNTDELNSNIAAIEEKYALMKTTGQTVDEVAKAQEILSAKESAYLSLISTDTTLVTKNNSVAKARLAEIKSGYEDLTKTIEAKNEEEKNSEAIKKLKTETEELTNKAKEFVTELSDKKLSDSISASLSQLEAMKSKTEEGSKEWKYYNEKIKELAELLGLVLGKEKQMGSSDLTDWAKSFSDKLEIVQDFASQYESIMSSISDMVCEQAENEATVKQAALETQLANGEISNEEYAAKLEEIEKESAQKQYKIQMWEWSANLLNIQAQTALAVVKALAEGGPYAGPAMAALMGVLGGVQLAAAIANKPVPPSYATGGVIGGYTGARTGTDDQIATVKTGEMVLNALQQKQLWNQLNGNSAGNVANNVTVKNFAAGNASVSSNFTKDGVELIIRETVKAQMSRGDYNNALTVAHKSMNGRRYVN